jgi:hypothetical protein
LFALDPVVVHFPSIEAPRRRRQPPRARLFAIGVDHGTTTPTEYTICPLAWQHLFVPAANLFVPAANFLFVCFFFFFSGADLTTFVNASFFGYNFSISHCV